MGTSAWLISRAAQHPSEASLTLAIVGVQFFGLSRGFLRYGERLVGHDAALRSLADLRVRVYERLEALAPAGLPGFRRGDLVARVVDDVDSLQDVVLRVIQPFAVAALVGSATVAALWWFLPQAGLVLLRRPGRLGHGGAVADRPPRQPRRVQAGDRARRAHRRRGRPHRGSTRARGHGRHRRPAGAHRRVGRRAALDRAAGRGHHGDRPRPHDRAGRSGQLGRADVRRARHPRRARSTARSWPLSPSCRSPRSSSSPRCRRRRRPSSALGWRRDASSPPSTRRPAVVDPETPGARR